MPPKKKSVQDKLQGLPGLDLGEIERVLAFMCEHNLDQFEFSLGDLHIALKRSPSAGAPAMASHQAHAVPAPAPAPAAAAPASEPAKATTPAPHADEHIVKSPIVGTFYAAPGPDTPPFVKVGDHVSKGQVVCIVEAMKLMNEIESDVAGTLARVLVENNQPVEYGQPLFAIRANGKA